jgi:hypothetical protein
VLHGVVLFIGPSLAHEQERLTALGINEAMREFALFICLCFGGM